MSDRCTTAIAVLAMVLSMRPAHSAGQGDRGLTNGPTPATKAWSPPRTPWGEPDLQGIWTNTQEFGTPFEKPAEYEGKTEQELRESLRTKLAQDTTAAERAKRRKLADDPANSGTGNGPVWWYENLDSKNSRLWSVVDPPDGRIPALTAEAKQRANARAEFLQRTHVPDPDAKGEYLPEGPEDLSLQDRCMQGIRMYQPSYYNNNYQILQSPGYVVVLYEWFHDVRSIPTDGRPAAGTSITQLSGISRGRWEGETLVVETTNFSETSFPNASERIFLPRPNSVTLRVTERFTRTGPDTLDYRFTVADPKTWVRPWTAAIPWTKGGARDKILEYACHEGNYSLRNILSGARAVEKRLATEKGNQR